MLFGWLLSTAQSLLHDAFLGRISVQYYLDHVVELHVILLEGFVEGLRLGEVPRKTVEKPAVLCVVLLEAVENHGDRDLVGHEFTAIYV